ncbi:MAG: hypothetical protein E4H17_03015 [Gemmatimonadales bacterium]|nr:MAG: hypothetical protein E4H17_03015 [Gemmatimonadales bacterium]
MNVSFEVQRAKFVRLFAGDALAWESPELSAEVVALMVPLTALRGTVFELRVFGYGGKATKQVRITKEAPPARPEPPKGKAETGLFNEGLQKP